MTTHPFLASYLDRSECEQCGQPEDDPRHREREPESEGRRTEAALNELVYGKVFEADFPRNVGGYFQAQGIRSPKNT